MSDAYYRAYESQQQIGRNQLARQAGGMLASGDLTGARNALYRGGELDAGGKLDDQLGTQRKAKAEAASRFAQGLGRMMDDPRFSADPAAAWQAAAPYAKRLGLDPADIEEDRELFVRDPKGYATMLFQKANEELQAVSLGNGGVAVFNKGTGALNVVREPQYEQEYVALPPGGALVPKPRGNMPPQTVTAGSPAPQQQADPQRAIADLTGMGARVTSGLRTPERNAAVGGVPNSRHLTGQAADLVPPPGMSMAQLEAETRRRMPGARVINEGDHVHVQWGGGQQQVAQASGQYPPGTIIGPPDTKGALEEQNLRSQIQERQQKITDAAEKTARGREAAAAKAATITQAVDQALSKIGRGEAGFIGAKMAEVPGTKAYDVARLIDTIKANLGFQELQAMRESSPTGGALGAIAVQELVALQATVASLDIGQSEPQLRASLQKIKQHYSKWQGTLGSGGAAPPPAAGSSEQAGKARGSASPPVSALKEGHITTFANGQRWTLRGGKPARVQ